MEVSFYKNFMLLALLVICFDEGFARNLINNVAVYDPNNSGDQNQIEKILSQLIPENDNIKATYDTYVNEKFGTICWNEITTLHFFKNGSHSGYVEYSISMELASEVDAHQNDNDLGEKYEIYNNDTKTTKILDFITVQSSLDDTVKKNKTMVCKSDKTYLKIFTNFGTKQRIEIRLKPDSHSLQFNLVHGSRVTDQSSGSYEGQTDSKSIQLPGSQENVQTFQVENVPSIETEENFQNGGVGFTQARIAFSGEASQEREEGDVKILSEELDSTKDTSEAASKLNSAMYESVSGEEAIEKEKQENAYNMGTELGEKIFTGEVGSEGDRQYWEVEAGHVSQHPEIYSGQTEARANHVSQHPEINFVQTKARAFTESLEDNKSSAEEEKRGSDGRIEGSFAVTTSDGIQNLKGPEGTMTTRKLIISDAKDQGCSHNKKVAITMNMNIEDDAGKIGNIDKTIEIDLDTPFNKLPRAGNFDEELISLMRHYYGDVLEKHKQCTKNQHVPMMRSFIDNSNEYEHYYNPYNIQHYVLRPQTTTGLFYTNPRGRYYVISSKNRNQNQGFFEKIANGLKSALTKLGQKK